MSRRADKTLDVLSIISILAVALFLISECSSQNPPLNVLNCVRPEGGQCRPGFNREPYPREFVNYLFWSARASFTQQSRGKLRLRHPQTDRYSFEIGDMSIRYDSAEYGQRTYYEGDDLKNEQYVGIPGWQYKDDRSARLFVWAWLTLWNAELVEPFKPDEIDWMVKLSVANARFHLGQRTMRGAQ